MWLNKLILAFLIFGHYSQADDSEDENVYTTTDPKKREPSPCEGILRKQYKKLHYFSLINSFFFNPKTSI